MKKQSTPLFCKMEALIGPDLLTEALRGKPRELIMTLIEGELQEVLAALPYERTADRQGYCNGKKTRTVTTGLGPTRIEISRARLMRQGQEEEWQSRFLPRYQRRAKAVDGALLGVYRTGGNHRRIKGALMPLLRGAPLNKSAISRIAGRLKSLFDQRRRRSLAKRDIRYLYLDGIALRVRVARKVVSVPVLVALGVNGQGQKEVLDLELCASESTHGWGGFVEGLVARGVGRAKLLIIDGSKGLRAAAQITWPRVAIQRCTVHKLRNLMGYAPGHAQEEVKADYHRIVYATGEHEAREAQRVFVAKWRKLAPKVAESLLEAGDELLSFYRFPQSQWKLNGFMGSFAEGWKHKARFLTADRPNRFSSACWLRGKSECVGSMGGAIWLKTKAPWSRLRDEPGCRGIRFFHMNRDATHLGTGGFCTRTG